MATKKPRGRKRTNDLYFGIDEEIAVAKFLQSDSLSERNEIYNKWLREPLNKMIESIIRRYKLYRDSVTFDDLHHDTLSFLITKADKFDVNKGKKAYSYYGTVCKHYIIGLLQKDDKQLKQFSSFETNVDSITQRDELIYELDDDNNDFKMDQFINRLIDEINDELNDTNCDIKKKLSENERRVGYSLIELLKNWEIIFGTMNGGSKYNKNSVLETMRNYTNLSTKDIRISMKRFKSMYSLIKYDSIDNGLL